MLRFSVDTDDKDEADAHPCVEPLNATNLLSHPPCEIIFDPFIA